MTEKERIQSHIAMCKCCLLADAMKECRTCLFNIGLAEQVKPADLIPLPIQFQTMLVVAA